MSTLTDVIAHPATAAAELERLRAVERKALEQSAYIQAHGLTEYEMARKDAELERLRARVAELEAEQDAKTIFIDWPGEDDMIVRCGQCHSAMTHVRPGKWQCDACEARRWEGAPLRDEPLCEEEA